MATVISKMVEMVLMMLIGVVCAKLKITGPEFNKHASALLTNVLIPATIFNSVTVDLNIGGSVVALLFVMYCVMMLIAGVFGKLTSAALHAKPDEAGVVFALVMFMNLVFIGFPLAETVYGKSVLFYCCLSCLPFNLLLYTVGTMSLKGAAGGKVSIKSAMNISMVASVLSIVIFALKIKFPAPVAATISSVAGATVPISMIILGTSLGGMSLKHSINDWRIYLISFVRLIVCPIVTYFVLKLFVQDDVLVGVVTILAATPAAVLLTPLSIEYGVDAQLASKGIFISTLMSVVTLPFIIWLLL